jgi:hypothetical protein
METLPFPYLAHWIVFVTYITSLDGFLAFFTIAFRKES